MKQLRITSKITCRDSESIKSYLSDISKIDLISTEEEVTLSVKIKEGDTIALEKLVSSNLRFVVSVAKQYQNMGMPSAPTAQAGLAFLKDIDRFRKRAIELSRSGLKEVREMIANTPSLSWHEPDSAGFACIKLPAGIDDLKFVMRLHEDHGVLIVPGGCFETPGTVRLSWIQAGDRLSEGLAKFLKAI